METKIMAIFTRTPLHVGAGNSVGAIDSPIQRERHTRIPIIPGSSLKGVLADLWTENLEKVEKNGKTEWLRKKGSDAEELFGQMKDEKRGTLDSAGSLLIGEARVLAFPVRSAKGSFAWITCPLALARYKRDSAGNFPLPEKIGENECIAHENLKLQDKVILEEYCFTAKEDNSFTAVSEALKNSFSGDVVWESIKERLVIVSDEIFSYFVENACEVVTRIRVDDETGTVAQGALFNQEQVPSETMFYAVIAAQDKKTDSAKNASNALKKITDKLDANKNIIQVGGNETIGLGYCSVKLN